MSHFATLVIVNETVDRASAEDSVTPLLAYDENGEQFRWGSRWDWWQVGGRWTGRLDGYDPEGDPANVEQCDLCGGTGRREDAERFGADWLERTGGCNGCMGKGRRLAWPTEWRAHEGDVAPVAHLLGMQEFFVPHALVTPNGDWHEAARMGWFGAKITDESGEGEKPEVLWASAVRALLEQHPDAYAVLVDCHV